MRLGRIIGNVVATIKDPGFTGKKLLLIQPVDGKGRPIGSPLVGMDAVGAGAGELVLYVGGKEASFPFLPQEVPVDAGIIAIIDSIDRVELYPEAAASAAAPGSDAVSAQASADTSAPGVAPSGAPLQASGDGASAALAARDGGQAVFPADGGVAPPETSARPARARRSAGAETAGRALHGKRS